MLGGIRARMHDMSMCTVLCSFYCFELFSVTAVVFSRMKQHQRSRSVGLEATVKRSGSTREENWDRAKRIIGGARKSMNGSRSAMVSGSVCLLGDM
uniref:Secreted protein n=1 Tax=Parascaris equorum TaxID=6256 RepID=A0A914RVD7_PAREQ